MAFFASCTLICSQRKSIQANVCSVHSHLSARRCRLRGSSHPLAALQMWNAVVAMHSPMKTRKPAGSRVRRLGEWSPSERPLELGPDPVASHFALLRLGTLQLSGETVQLASQQAPPFPSRTRLSREFRFTRFPYEYPHSNPAQHLLRPPEPRTTRWEDLLRCRTFMTDTSESRMRRCM